MADWKRFWPTLVELETSASPAGGQVVLNLSTTQGASLRQVKLLADGYNPIDPRLERLHLSATAQAELLDLCRPGGAVQELCAALLPVGRKLRVEHPALDNFTWRWTPVSGRWSAGYRAERSVAAFIWSAHRPPASNQDSLSFAYFRADGSFDLCLLRPPFSHRAATSSGKVFAGNMLELRTGLAIEPGRREIVGPQWKSRLRADLMAVRSTISICEVLRHR